MKTPRSCRRRSGSCPPGTAGEGKGADPRRDALAAERRRMPWLAVDKTYQFDGPDGRASLLSLRWPPSVDRLPCLLRARGHHLRRGRHLSGAGLRGLLVGRRPGRAPRPPERAEHDAGVRLARPPGRDPGPEARHRWEHIPWYTITDDFDNDFDVDQWHGTNAFLRQGDRIFRTYLINARGDEQMGNTWNYLDITALGRQEQWEDSPEGSPQPRRTSGGTTTTPTARAGDHPISGVSMEVLARSPAREARPALQQRHPSSSSL